MLYHISEGIKLVWWKQCAKDITFDSSGGGGGGGSSLGGGGGGVLFGGSTGGGGTEAWPPLAEP